ncbi:MAG: FecR domain-containing protein [Prolixibacteraceae bacterium]
MITNEQLNNQIRNLIDSRKAMDEDEKISEAGAVIGNLQRVDTSGAWQKIEVAVKGKSKPVRLIRLLTRVAAILFIPLLLYSVWSTFLNSPDPANGHFAMQELSSPAGIRSKVCLPDGTTVWLNGESTIRFRVPFVDERQVELSGEAYFDVIKNEKAPFFVDAGMAKIEVLGTRFNCKAYADDELIDIVLVEGKINLQADKNDGNARNFIMKPNEHAVIRRETGETKVAEEDIDKYVAWHQNRLMFENSTLDEVASQLERWYDLDVLILDHEIRGYRYTTTFENETLAHVVELLSLSTPIKISYAPAREGKRAVLSISKK